MEILPTFEITSEFEKIKISEKISIFKSRKNNYLTIKQRKTPTIKKPLHYVLFQETPKSKGIYISSIYTNFNKIKKKNIKVIEYQNKYYEIYYNSNTHKLTLTPIETPTKQTRGKKWN